MVSRVLAVLAALLVQPAAAQTVVDGDAIKLNGTTWRLWGRYHGHRSPAFSARSSVCGDV